MKFSKKDFQQYNLETLELDKEHELSPKLRRSIEFVSVPNKKKRRSRKRRLELKNASKLPLHLNDRRSTKTPAFVKIPEIQLRNKASFQYSKKQRNYIQPIQHLINASKTNPYFYKNYLVRNPSHERTNSQLDGAWSFTNFTGKRRKGRKLHPAYAKSGIKLPSTQKTRM